MLMRRFLPSLTALTAFEAAATYLNFTRAGEDIGLTQSGVSRQVGNLEKLLGVRLFERIGPRLVLTSAGRNYLESITKLLDGLEEASIDTVRGSRLQDATRIGVQDSFASQWLVPRMAGFMKRFPDTQFNMVPTTDNPNFSEDNIDIAVLRGRGAWTDAHAYKLFEETMVVVAAPSLIPKGEKLEARQYNGFQKIQNARRPDSWLRWLEAMNMSHDGPIFGPRFAQTTMVIKAAVSGLGVAVVPTVMVEDYLRDGQLHCPFGEPVLSGYSYFAVYPINAGVSKRVLDFRDWITAETRPLRANSLKPAGA